MKSILVPTDFSLCAHHAFDAAVKLARRFDSIIHLLSNIDIPINWTEWTASEKAAHQKSRQLIEKTEQLLKNAQEQYADIDIRTHFRGGALLEAVQSFAEQHGTDLVVMGSHGASGKNEYFIGSNTQKVVRRLHCPVLVIKEPLESIDFDKVIFASNFHQNEKEAFLKFKQFVSPFMPEIYLLEVHTSSLADPPYILSKEAMADFAALGTPFKCKTIVHKDYSVDSGIRAFAEKIGAKLIGISNHQRRPLKRMLVGSNVEALVNHSDIPVLSIDYTEV
jgi:nucleotide-binding universal stress UspA family protein